MRLRIGLHRGRPTLTETGYVGIAVHTAARISFAAHGGQIVASSSVQSALARRLSARAVDAGAARPWRFQGLPDAVELFQVDAKGLVAEFPPLRSGSAVG